MPGSLPQPFMDRNGENIKLQNLLEQINRKIEPTNFDNTLLPIRSKLPAQRYNPANDAATVNDVYNDPINNTSGFTAINGDKIETVPKARKVPVRKPKVTIVNDNANVYPSGSESDMGSMSSVFPAPSGVPSRSKFNKQMEAQNDLFGEYN
jgi:hypothetical protein